MKTMANKKTWLGILAMALVFGMMVVGCSGDGGGDTGGSPWIPVDDDERYGDFIGTLSADGKTLTVSYDNGFSIPYTKNTGGLNGVWYEKDQYSRLVLSDNANWVRGWKSLDETFFDSEKGTLTVQGTTVTFTMTHYREEDWEESSIIGGDDSSWTPIDDEGYGDFIGTLSADGKTLTVSYVDDGYSILYTKNTGGLNGVWYDEDQYTRLTISGNANWVAGEKSAGTFIDVVKGTLTIQGTTITFTMTHFR